MRRRPILPLAVLCAAALALPGAAVAATGNGTFAGTLGATVPKGAQATVRAVDRSSGALVAAQGVGRSGRFSLSLPAGGYVVLGTIAPVRRGAKLTQLRIGVSVKAGQRRRNVSLRAPKRKRKRRTTAPKGRAAYVQEHGEVTPGRVAAQIYDVTGDVTGDFAVVMPGINDFVLDNVLNGPAGQECGVAVLETDRIADVLKELEFQQSPYVDPATRVTRNFILGDVEVRGTLNRIGPGNDAATLTFTLKDKASGEVLDAVSGRLDAETFFDDLDAVGNRLGDALCKITDVFEVTLDVAGRGDFATHAGSGTLHAVLRARRTDPKVRRWTAEGPLQWGGLTASTKIPECPLIDPTARETTWTVTITQAAGGGLEVAWGPTGNDMATASVDCSGDPDPPPIPGQALVSLLNTGPASFPLPAAGGTQPVSGEVLSDGDGFRDTGTITVRPAGVARAG